MVKERPKLLKEFGEFFLGKVVIVRVYTDGIKSYEFETVEEVEDFFLSSFMTFKEKNQSTKVIGKKIFVFERRD